MKVFLTLAVAALPWRAGAGVSGAPDLLPLSTGSTEGDGAAVFRASFSGQADEAGGSSDAVLDQADDAGGSSDAVPDQGVTHTPTPSTTPLGEEHPRFEAIARSLLAGLSTSLGAAIVLLLRGAPSSGQMAFALALAGGVMITVSLLEMWLPQLRRPGRRLDCLIGAGIGLLGFLALKMLVPEPQLAPHSKACEDLEGDPESGQAACRSPDHHHKVRQWRLAVLLTVALTAHNFPEGLAVAVSSLQSERLGFVVMAAIAVHNIPEGIAIAMPVLDATGSRLRAMQMATFSGLAEPLGAILAVTALPDYALKGRGMDALLCVIGGIMTSVALTELLPEAQAQMRPLCSLGGLATGVAVMLLTHELA